LIVDGIERFLAPLNELPSDLGVLNPYYPTPPLLYSSHLSFFLGFYATGVSMETNEFMSFVK